MLSSKTKILDMAYSPDPLTPAEQNVLNIIAEHHALISMVSDMPMLPNSVNYEITIDYTDIDYEYLDQIADPTINRPSRSAHFFRHANPMPTVIKKMNMKTLKIHDHKPGQNRFTKHLGQEYQYTAKTSTSLIPTDPRYMELFFCDQNVVGLLWDIQKCNLKKEKYVYATDGDTDLCQWLDLNTDERATEAEKIAELTRCLKEKPLATMIASLQEKNNQAVREKKSITWNEILAGVPKGVINAVFASQDVRSTRLRAAKLMLHIKEKLKLTDDLPILIIQPYYAEIDYTGASRKVPARPAVFRVYSKSERDEDFARTAADEKVTQTALEIIQSQRALACMVSDKTQLDKILNQTTDIETALLPSEPQWMKLSHDNQAIGLLWDIDSCEHHETASNLAALREQNTRAVDAQQAIERNSVLAKIPKGQVNGVFCLSDDRASRLKALEMAQYIKEKLCLTVNVPIYVIQSSSINNDSYPNGPTFHLHREYEQVADSVDELWWENRTQLTQATLIARRQQRHLIQNEDDFVIVNHKDAKEEKTQERLASRCAVM